MLLRFCLAWNLGIMLGQGSGGFLFPRPHGPVIAYLLCSASMLAVALLAWRMKPAPRDGGAVRAQTSVTNAVTDRRAARWFAAMGWTGLFGCTFTLALLMFVFPKLAVSLGISSQWHGLMLVGHRLLSMGIYFVLHATQFWRYRLTTSLAAHAFGIGALALLVLCKSTPLIFIGVVATALLPGTVYYLGIFYGANAFSDQRKGWAGSIHETIIAIGVCAGALLGGYIGDRFGVRAPFIVAIWLVFLLALVQLLIYAIYRRKTAGLPAGDKPASPTGNRR